MDIYSRFAKMGLQQNQNFKQFGKVDKGNNYITRGT